MAEFREDTDVYPVMLALAECATAELVKSGLTPITKVTVQPGPNPVMDYVGNGDDCGEIIVNLNTGFPVDGFPNPAEDGLCTSEFAYEVALAIFRCAPPLHGTKNAPLPPTPEEQTNATREYLADMAAMKRAILCCMQQQKRQYVLRVWTGYGPSGNVVGGVWTVLVGPVQ